MESTVFVYLFHAICAGAGLTGYAVFARWERNPSFAFYLAGQVGLVGIFVGLFHCLQESGEAVLVWFGIVLLFVVAARFHCWKNRTLWVHPPEFQDALLIYGGSAAMAFGVILSAEAVLASHVRNLLVSSDAGTLIGFLALGFAPVVTMAITDLRTFFRGLRSEQ